MQPAQDVEHDSELLRWPDIETELLDPVADKERSWITQSKCQVTLVLTLAASE